MISMTAIGNIGSEPELRFTSAGQQVLSFSVASNSRQKVGEEWRDVVTWVRVSWFGGKRAESLAPLISKGSSVFVVGEGSIRKYTDRDGVERQSLELKAYDVGFAGRRPDGAGQSAQGGDRRAPGGGGGSPGRVTPASLPGDPAVGGDDIPFASCDPTLDPMWPK